MKTLVRVLFFGALILVLATPLFARGAWEVDFPAEFEEALLAEGFSEEDAQAIAEAARSHDWSNGESADPELIAAAIAQVRADGAAMTPDQSAELALQLAESAVALEDEGYRDSEIAEATLNAVQILHGQIQAWQESGGDEILGEIIRDTVRDEVIAVAEERGDDETPAAGETPADDKVPVEPGPDAADDKIPVEPGPGAAGAGDR